MPTTSSNNSEGGVVTEEYVLITVAKQHFIWEARILSRGLPYLPVRVSLPNRLRTSVRLAVGDICSVNMTDADLGVGAGDIIEKFDNKDIRKLRHKKIIPEEDEYAYLLVSDKKLGYTGGAFPYKAKLSGMGPSTMPEDPDVIQRTKQAEKKLRREARKLANGGISPADSSPSTSPQLGPNGTPPLSSGEGGSAAVAALDSPAAAEGGGGGLPPLTLASEEEQQFQELQRQKMKEAAAAKGSQASEDEDDDEEEEKEEEEEGANEEGEEEDLENIVNPNRGNNKWLAHDGGVSKGYVSKRERRDLEFAERRKKRAEPPPKQSPSLIPQMEALDRVGGDAELDNI